MKTIIFTIIVALAIGFFLGLLLGLFKKLFAVKVDPKIQQVRDLLSGANCGGCGYAGCDAFAEAVVNGEAAPGGCVAGGASTAEQVAAVMGGTSEATAKKIAFIACKGDSNCAKDKGVYNGVKTCKGAQLVMNGTKKCAFGCIGFGDCVSACPFDALKMDTNGLPVIDKEKCVACGNCIKACPKKLIKLVEAETKGPLAKCSNKSDNKPQIRKDCTAGCFKCGMCARKCTAGAVDISSGIPVIDYEKCTACGECIKACPDKVLEFLN